MPKYLVVGPASFGMPGDTVELTEAEAAEANAQAAFPVVQRRQEVGMDLGFVGQGVDSPMDQVLAVSKEVAARMMQQQHEAAKAFVQQQITGVRPTFTQVEPDFTDDSTAWHKVGAAAEAETPEAAANPLILPEHLQTEVTEESKQADAELAQSVHDLAASVYPEGEEPKVKEAPKPELPAEVEPEAPKPELPAEVEPEAPEAKEASKAKKPGRKAAK